MPEIPRMKPILPEAGGMISPDAARGATTAQAALGRSITELAADYIEKKRIARINAEKSRAVSEAIIQAQQWISQQQPYDENGAPTFDTMPQEAEKAWQKITESVLENVKDDQARIEIERSLTGYKATFMSNVIGKAHAYELAHIKGSTVETLQNLRMAAAAAGEDEFQVLLQRGEAAVEAAVQSGAIAAPEGKALLNDFKQDTTQSRYEAMALVDPVAVITNLDNIPLDAERREIVLSKAIRRVEQLEDRAWQQKQRIMAQNANALAAAIVMGNGTAEDVKREAARGGLTASDTMSLLNLAQLKEFGEDDPLVVRELYTKYAYGELTVSDVVNAAASRQLSRQTFLDFVNKLHSTASANAVLGSNVYKIGLDYLESWLDPTGEKSAMNPAYGEMVARTRLKYTDLILKMTEDGTRPVTKEMVDEALGKIYDEVSKPCQGVVQQYGNRDNLRTALKNGSITAEEYRQKAACFSLLEGQGFGTK